ncbi:amidohydrolase family protein [Streptomyces sp. NPDC046900]|uniref:amidohydrolase family protein n=1 Tax=Streptomyces sp. NPDC046900 TaxID=3155473 RepID=UPI0033D204CE
MRSPGRIVYQGALLFDGTGAPAREADVSVEHGRIVAVGSGLDGDTAVPLAGCTLLPGFVDCHVHVMVSSTDLTTVARTSPAYRLLQATVNLRRTLAAGVTLARDADGAEAALRDALADGLITGPRLKVAVSMIGQTGGRSDGWMPAGFDFPAFDVGPGRPSGVADGVDEVRRTARRIIRAGADVLKVAVSGSLLAGGDPTRHTHFRAEEIAAAVAEAEAAGLPAMAHAHSAAGAKAAVRAGVRSIEHGTALDDETLELMAERGTWLVPTLAATRATLTAHELAGAPRSRIDQLAETVARHTESVTRAWRAGVRLAMGSDSGVTPHGANLLELAELSALGLPAAEVLVAGTSSGAALLGAGEEAGTLEPGKRADIVVLAGGVEDLSTLPDRIRAVLLGGRLRAGAFPVPVGQEAI